MRHLVVGKGTPRNMMLFEEAWDNSRTGGEGKEVYVKVVRPQREVRICRYILRGKKRRSFP